MIPLVSILISTILFCLMVFWTSQLETPEEEEKNFKTSHMYTGFEEEFADISLYREDDDYMYSTFVWGITGIDRTGFRRFVPQENRGTATFEPSFDVRAVRQSKVHSRRLREDVDHGLHRSRVYRNQHFVLWRGRRRRSLHARRLSRMVQRDVSDRGRL